MPRPSLADVRRPQILEAYERCLVRYGAEATTLDRIAKEAGVTRALVRHYLGNRREVDRALVAQVRGTYVAWFLNLTVDLPVKERLTRILDALFAEVSAGPSQVVDALFGLSAEDPALRDDLREMYLELEHLLDSELASARPDANPSRRRGVAYGILCLVGMHRSLVDVGFPSERGSMARTCAQELVDTL